MSNTIDGAQIDTATAVNNSAKNKICKSITLNMIPNLDLQQCKDLLNGEYLAFLPSKLVWKDRDGIRGNDSFKFRGNDVKKYQEILGV